MCFWEHSFALYGVGVDQGDSRTGGKPSLRPTGRIIAIAFFLFFSLLFYFSPRSFINKLCGVGGKHQA